MLNRIAFLIPSEWGRAYLPHKGGSASRRNYNKLMSLIGDMRREEIEYCRNNPEYFVDTYGHIEDKDNAESIIQPFSMWQAQRDAFRSILENKFNVILKARQLGFTWLVLHIVAWMTLCFEGRTVIALSQKEDDAKELKASLGRGGELAVPKGTIITPAAKDVFSGAGITVKTV